MKYFRAMLVGATLSTGASTWAAAQAVVPVQWGWTQRDSDDRAAFRDGYRQGRWDASHGQRANYGNTGSWRSNDDRLAYRNGYIQGYREGNGAYRGSGPYDRDGDRDRDDGYRAPYGRGGFGNYAATARQFGYQDGLNDGQTDRRTGHSFRPTHDSNYRHADRGYDGFGNKDDYKQAYRDAYSQGYQNGYNGGPWQRR
jgi:hypothetical protein